MVIDPLPTYAAPDDPPLRKAVITSIEYISGRNRLDKIYRDIQLAEATGGRFFKAALAALNVPLDYDPGALARIPAEGPLIFVANHPYGVIDGLAVCHLASLVRPNFQSLVNQALCQADHLADYFLPIDFSESRAAALTNIDTKRRALASLNAGGLIVIFPAGGIATAHTPFGRAVDLEWKLFMAKMVQMARATVVPIFFHGQNSPLFQMVSQVSLTLRLALIMREVNRREGKPLQISVGEPLPFERLAHIRGREALTRYLRQATYELGAVDRQTALRHSSLDRWPLKYRRLRSKEPGRFL